MRKFFILLIRLYQLCLSPFLGRCCRFVPSCSEYAQEALERYGLLKGGWLAIKRLVKCGPWNRGGYDPVNSEEFLEFCQDEWLPTEDGSPPSKALSKHCISEQLTTETHQAE